MPDEERRIFEPFVGQSGGRVLRSPAPALAATTGIGRRFVGEVVILRPTAPSRADAGRMIERFGVTLTSFMGQDG